MMKIPSGLLGRQNSSDDLDPESLSDIDDMEVEGYLHNEEETQHEKVIWEEINKEYLEQRKLWRLNWQLEVWLWRK